MSLSRKLRNCASASLSLLAVLVAVLPAQAQSGDQIRGGVGQAGDVQQQLARAATVVQEMKADPPMAALLRTAKGVFVVPTLVRGGLGVAARGARASCSQGKERSGAHRCSTTWEA